jgi:hypothetical protein
MRLATNCTPVDRVSWCVHIEYTFPFHIVRWYLSAIILTPLARRSHEKSKARISRNSGGYHEKK